MAEHEKLGGFEDHPENAPESAADYMNKRRPEPHTLEELAAEPDPVEVRKRNEASTRQAILWAAASVVGTFLVAGILYLIPGLDRIPWAIASSVYPSVMLVGCAVIMVRKLNRYERWIPWMGVFWLPLVPFTMAWLIYTLGIVAEQTAQ